MIYLECRIKGPRQAAPDDRNRSARRDQAARSCSASELFLCLLKGAIIQINAALPTYPVTSGDINIYHARLIADQQITYVLQFSSLLDLDQLDRALGVLLRKFPILSYVIRVEPRRFQRKPMSDYCLKAKLADETESVSEAVDRFTGAACDPEQEPPLKLLLIRHAGVDTLCFKVDHMATDAAGLKVLLYAFAAAYTKGDIDQAFNSDRGIGQIFRSFSPLALLRAASKAGLPRPGREMIDGPFDAQSTFIEHVQLAPVEYERMHAAAKRAGATVNDVLLAALYRIIWQRQNADQAGAFPVMVPVDMRRYLPHNQQKSVANLSSAVYPSLAAVPGESFSETLVRITARTQAFKQNSPGLAAMILMRIGAIRGGRMMQAKYQLAATHQSRFICLTNFGVIDAAQCDFGVPLAHVYGVGPIQYAPGMLIAVSTYADTMHVTVQGNDKRRFQPFVRDFLNSMMGELAGWKERGQQI